MKKRLPPQNTIAPLTARASQQPADEPPPRATPSPWLSRQVTQRLDEGRTLLIDLATDLPFAMVLRGRVSPPKPQVLVHAEPMAKVIDQFGARMPGLTIDAAYLRERRALIDRLESFEKAGENFLGLIRRTRAVMAAQVEKAMRGTYAIALDAAAGDPDLHKAIQPFGPALSSPADKPRKQ